MRKEDFYVIGVYSNPSRFDRRHELFCLFKEHMRQSGAQLVIVEAAFGDRPHVVTEEGNPLHIRLRYWDEIWQKEAMVNVGISRLYEINPNWQGCAWIDGDVKFHRENWVEEICLELDRYMWMQLWSDSVDLGPNEEIMSTFKSFMNCYFNDIPRITYKPNPQYNNGTYWHPGYAWGARREALEAVGGLLDCAILGAGDHHMAMSLIGEGHLSYPKKIDSDYKRRVEKWQELALKYVSKDVGYLKAQISHAFHGKKKDRKYWGRWDIITDDKMDFDRDFMKDYQGLWKFTGNQDPLLAHNFKKYFIQRNEDSIDL